MTTFIHQYMMKNIQHIKGGMIMKEIYKVNMKNGQYHLIKAETNDITKLLEALTGKDRNDLQITIWEELYSSNNKQYNEIAIFSDNISSVEHYNG